MTGLIAKPLTPAAPAKVELTPEQERAEFDQLSLELRLHDNKQAPLEPEVYKKKLQRALDIISRMNQTTAGPKAANKKIGTAKKAPLSLSDL